MTKRYQLYSIGNGVLDILGNIQEAEFGQMMLTKGSMNLVDSTVQKKLMAALEQTKLSFASGGSAANSVVAFQALGGNAAFGCVLGDDAQGNLYKSDFEKLGIALNCRVVPGATTATSVILITPDGERTMNTCLGVAGDFNDTDIDPAVIAQSEWVYIEGYLLSSKERGFKAAMRLAEVAKQHGTKVALTFSDSFLVHGFREQIDSIINHCDLVFANNSEALAYAQTESPERAFDHLKSLVPNVVMTRSEKGAWIRFDGEDFAINSTPCKPVDATGAGDAFAGAFLYGITNGASPANAGRAASYIAYKTISQIGPRLPNGDYKVFWKESLKG